MEYSIPKGFEDVTSSSKADTVEKLDDSEKNGDISHM